MLLLIYYLRLYDSRACVAIATATATANTTVIVAVALCVCVFEKNLNKSLARKVRHGKHENKQTNKQSRVS